MSLTYAAQQTENNSGRKTIVIAVVALIHIGFFYGLTHGLKVANIVQLKDTITVLIPEETKPETPPPTPKVKPADVPIDKMVPDTPPVVTPEIPLNTEPVDTAITADAAASTAESAAPTAAFSITHRVNPAYPASSQRAGESGTVLLDVIVGPTGVPTDVNVATSSGYSALDQAAVEAVRKWRFTVSEAGTAHLRLPVTFKLQTIH